MRPSIRSELLRKLRTSEPNKTGLGLLRIGHMTNRCAGGNVLRRRRKVSSAEPPWGRADGPVDQWKIACFASRKPWVQIPAGPRPPHGRRWRRCGSFRGSSVPAGPPLRGPSSRRWILGVPIRGMRFLVLDEKIGPCQVTGSGKRLSPERLIFGISGIDEIVVLDSVIA